jgi:hypothetical protein
MYIIKQTNMYMQNIHKIKSKKWPTVETIKAYRSSGSINTRSTNLSINKNRDTVNYYINKMKNFKKNINSNSINKNTMESTTKESTTKELTNKESTTNESTTKESTKESNSNHTVIQYKPVHLSPNSPLSVEKINQIKWKDASTYTIKLNIELMEKEYGANYTKDLIYSVLNDKFGLLWLFLQGAENEAKLYLSNN